MEQNCIVKDCNNISSDMTFYNGICAQCYMYLTEGVGNGQIYRNLIRHLLTSLFVYLKKEDENFEEKILKISSLTEQTPNNPKKPKLAKAAGDIIYN